MDLPPSNCSRGEVAGADPAFMLFGKQIKGPLPTNEIKEELSPRGVDERGVSLATSSDEEEDLNASVEATCEVMQWRKRKITEGDCLVQSFTGIQELEKQQNTNEGNKCLGGGIEMEKHTNTERELKWEGDMQARKRQVGLWSRCPRCNSTDTKFCYFNNYNVNQPRHFCKHCQRYWTAGGTLRNVPVGAGKRKSKHALRKEAFFMSPVCAANSTASLDAPAEGTEANQEVKSGSAKVNVDVLADTGGIRDADDQIPICIPSEPCPAMVRMPPVNTDLELCGHQSTSLPMNTTCTQSQCTSLNTLSPDMVTPLQQLHMRSSPLSSGSAKCSSGLAKVSDDSDRYVPGRGCSKFSEISSNLADGRASGSAGLSQISAEWQTGSSGLSPDWQSGSSGLSQISAYLSGLSHPSAYLQSHELRSSPYWEGGLAKRDPDLANEFQPNPDDELPSTDQKRTELAKINSSSHHGLSVPPSFEKELPLVKGGDLNSQHNTSLPLLDPNLLPYFYHMYCVAPLAYAHLKPFLTPQGWAFPFIPPNIEALSSPTQSTRIALEKTECPHARSPLTIDTISTCTI